ncbi:hypothetical protein SISSUDRAFT_1003901 [Sistotremastrum suecicum HHB10207 ss-3]|uniref:Xylanolytic transcriptional activator regulatory domain-containing protein n=1 Tax=Sistotremastrum suecicum HHB10207 ss-3 TaxID=1314776 RepID=A0A166E179_9AGAM|nr:hypothetical protein SISSUDRAFT_1003901 [Sistotremastrum suecicum HHB10207 ss-3]
MADNRCSNCLTLNLECTYIEAAKKRGPPKGYVESLENRLEKMEKLLRSLCPDADFTQELGQYINRETWYHDRSTDPTRLITSNAKQPTPPRHEIPAVAGMRPTPGSKKATVREEDLAPSDDEELVHATLAEGLKRLAVNTADSRFHGKSSGIMLVQAAMDMKREYSGIHNLPSPIPENRLQEFWTPPLWEWASADQPDGPVPMPEPDLFYSLTDLFFRYVNAFLPLLHRPTYERLYKERQWEKDKSLASVILVTCAVASRWSDDPRVLWAEEGSQHSAGWKFFEQSQSLRKSPLAQPCLYDLQAFALSAMFLQGSSAPHAGWTMVGVGIRLAQDVGAHRRKVQHGDNPVEDELWKRAFWCLVAQDRLASSSLGRPCAIQDEDFDIEMPLEVDDEFWEHPDPDKAFKQPSDRPSMISYFNSFLKLNQILAFALRTIYSINKSKILLGFVGPQWEQHIVAELDSALNKWIDSVPDHLKWDPQREDPLFFDQSVSLYATYYHLQILIHRPFIPTPRKPSPLSFPSLAICTNAARSCSHVVDIQRRRTQALAPQLQSCIFTSGIVLLLNIWGAKKSGLYGEPSKQMQDVHKCMQYLKQCEHRWRTAGRLWDILYELASVGELPLPQPSPPETGYKRERDSDSPIANASNSRTSSTTDLPSTLPGSRPIAKARQPLASRGAARKVSQPQASPSASHEFVPPSLANIEHPATSVVLGQLPLHPDYSYRQASQENLGTMPWYPYHAQPSHQHQNHQQPTYGNQSQPSTSQVLPPSQQTTPRYEGPPQQPQTQQGLMYSIFADASNPQMAYPNSVSYDPYIANQTQLSMNPHGNIHPQPSAFSTPSSQQSSGAPSTTDVDLMGGMWSTAPASFEYDDWGNYLSSGIDPSTGLLLGITPDHSSGVQPPGH